MDPKQDNQGGNDAGDNRQAIFTPQLTITDASVPAPESAQASDGSSTHPYFSSHPTQTFNTDTGDIIIKNGEPKPKHNKRPFIIGGIILAVFVVICAIILTVISVENSTNAATILEKNLNALRSTEDFFYRASKNQIAFTEIINAATHDSLGQWVEQLAKLPSQLNEANLNKMNDDERDTFTAVQQQLNVLIPKWQSAYAFYSQVYNAFNQENVDYFISLAADENPDLAAVGQRFKTFFENDAYWDNLYTENNCASNQATTECEYIDSNYTNNTLLLLSSPQVTKMIFAVYDDSIYLTPDAISAKVQTLTSETK